MELPDLQSELTRYEKDNEHLEAQITKSRESIYWNNKRIKLIRQQIEAAKEAPASEVLKEISENGLS